MLIDKKKYIKHALSPLLRASSVPFAPFWNPIERLGRVDVKTSLWLLPCIDSLRLLDILIIC